MIPIWYKICSLSNSCSAEQNPCVLLKSKINIYGMPDCWNLLMAEMASVYGVKRGIEQKYLLLPINIQVYWTNAY